jgi:large subunit ribosomal protein L4
VRAGGRKPWRQKGTGRARAGTRASPLWRGGGVTFGPKPRSYAPKVNKKIRKQALKMALSTKCNEQRMLVLDDFALAEIKTKAFLKVLENLGIENALVVIPQRDEVLERSARNIPRVKIMHTHGLNVYDILRYEQMILVKEAIPHVEESLLS